MTLHEAIAEILRYNNRSMTTVEVAHQLNKNKLYIKKDKSVITAYQIYGRINNYSNLFNRNGNLVSLKSSSEKIFSKTPAKFINLKNREPKVKNRDEDYIIDLCDRVLHLKAFRQKRFDFLLGDPGPNGKCVKLPVDAYYEELNVVIEYYERQHTEPVKFFDKKMTNSGVYRNEQRKIYDDRRRKVLPENGIHLIEISYSDFAHGSQKRIIRNLDEDVKIIAHILKNIKRKSNDW